MDETTKFTSCTSHELRVFVWGNPHSLIANFSFCRSQGKTLGEWMSCWHKSLISPQFSNCNILLQHSKSVFIDHSERISPLTHPSVLLSRSKAYFENTMIKVGELSGKQKKLCPYHLWAPRNQARHIVENNVGLSTFDCRNASYIRFILSSFPIDFWAHKECVYVWRS